MTTRTNTTEASKANPETRIVEIINSRIVTAFNYIAPINLMHVFRGTAMIPAIVDTSIKEGWNQSGLVRTVYFKDGSTSRESLLSVEAPTFFSYKNEQFTSKVLALLLTRLEGEWTFTDLGNNTTKIEWTYRAIPTNVFTKQVVKWVLMKQVHQMLANAMAIIKTDLESGNLQAGTTWKVR